MASMKEACVGPLALTGFTIDTPTPHGVGYFLPGIRPYGKEFAGHTWESAVAGG